MLLLEAVSLHVASVQALTRRAARRRSWERVLIRIHAVGYLTVVFLVLSPVKAVVFIIMQQGLFGLYLGCSFAPNHKGMPILDAADRSDFLRRQVLTSRNVRGGWLTDLALGGLNYQIEHHLFPSMPRPNLRRSQAMIEEFCRSEACPTARAAWRAPTSRRCGTSTPSAGQPARPPRPDRRPASRQPACRLYRVGRRSGPRCPVLTRPVPAAAALRRKAVAGHPARPVVAAWTAGTMSSCRPGPVMRKSLATGGARAASRETPLSSAAPGAHQHGEAAGVTATHLGRADDEPAAAGGASRGVARGRMRCRVRRGARRWSGRPSVREERPGPGKDAGAGVRHGPPVR